MAKIETVERICDLPHVMAGDVEGERVVFGWNGAEYEIDLCAPHADNFRQYLGGLIEYGRGIPSTRRRVDAKKARSSGNPKSANRAHPPASRKPAPRSATSRRQSADIRARAAAAGETVNPRGRIPADIVFRYGN